ncbi:MAG: archaeal proteasome endopeptidase complex subunit beta [Euryarchaeota archaeon]|nr:archaeal proteasome endopeptidase complex subunit beta [Euryarchaeota archaeon]
MEAVERVKEYMKGTTTIGLTTGDGVVLVSDKRATMGTLIAHKMVQKSFIIDKHLAATVAGAVGDAQALIRWMRAEARLYRMRKGEEISVGAISTLMGNVLFSSRYFPLIVQLIIGGVDRTGARLYSLDPLGSAIEDRVIATGSGSPYAYGVLEDAYSQELGIDEATRVALRAMRAALERDAMSGNGIDVIKITRDGAVKLSEDEVNKLIEAL